MIQRIEVRLDEMKLYGYHGLYEEEKENGNDFVLNVVIEMNYNNHMKLEDTVDYVKLKEVMKKEFEKPEELLENLAHRLGSKIMAKFEKIQNLELEVKKLNPPMDVKVKSSSVRIKMKR